MCLALVRNCDAHFVSIESPALRAGETDLVVPVPGGAATVSGLGVVEVREETSAIDKVVSLEAGGTMSSFVVSLALIGNWDAHLIGVKGPMFRAGKADLVVPVPGSTATVSGLGVVEIREETSAIDKVVSLEAGGTSTAFVMALALIRHRHADFVSIENPVFGAGEADLVVPVPGGAATVSGLGVVEVREETSTIDKVISLEAGGTMSSFVVSFALVSNWHTNLISVESPSLGAGETDLAVPVPGGTSNIGWLSVVEVGEDACSLL